MKENDFKKRALAFLLVLLMVLGNVPVFGAEVSVGNDITTGYENGVLSVHNSEKISIRELSDFFGDFEYVKIVKTGTTDNAFEYSDTAHALRTFTPENNKQYSLYKGKKTGGFLGFGGTLSWESTSTDFVSKIYDRATISITIDGIAGSSETVNVYRGESVNFTVADKDGYNVTVTGAVKNNDGSYKISGLEGDATVTVAYQGANDIETAIKWSDLVKEGEDVVVSYIGETATTSEYIVNQLYDSVVTVDGDEVEDADITTKLECNVNYDLNLGILGTYHIGWVTLGDKIDTSSIISATLSQYNLTGRLADAAVGLLDNYITDETAYEYKLTVSYAGEKGKYVNVTDDVTFKLEDKRPTPVITFANAVDGVVTYVVTDTSKLPLDNNAIIEAIGVSVKDADKSEIKIEAKKGILGGDSVSQIGETYEITVSVPLTDDHFGASEKVNLLLKEGRPTAKISASNGNINVNAYEFTISRDEILTALGVTTEVISKDDIVMTIGGEAKDTITATGTYTVSLSYADTNTVIGTSVENLTLTVVDDRKQPVVNLNTAELELNANDVDGISEEEVYNAVFESVKVGDDDVTYSTEYNASYVTIEGLDENAAIKQADKSYTVTVAFPATNEYKSATGTITVYVKGTKNATVIELNNSGTINYYENAEKGVTEEEVKELITSFKDTTASKELDKSALTVVVKQGDNEITDYTAIVPSETPYTLYVEFAGNETHGAYNASAEFKVYDGRKDAAFKFWNNNFPQTNLNFAIEENSIASSLNGGSVWDKDDLNHYAGSAYIVTITKDGQPLEKVEGAYVITEFGAYEATFKFDGNNEYKECTGSATFEVTDKRTKAEIPTTGVTSVNYNGVAITTDELIALLVGEGFTADATKLYRTGLPVVGDLPTTSVSSLEIFGVGLIPATGTYRLEVTVNETNTSLGNKVNIEFTVVEGRKSTSISVNENAVINVEKLSDLPVNADRIIEDMGVVVKDSDGNVVENAVISITLITQNSTPIWPTLSQEPAQIKTEGTYSVTFTYSVDTTKYTVSSALVTGTVTVNDAREAVTFNIPETVEVVYGEYTLADVLSALTTGEYTGVAEVENEELTFSKVEGLNAGEHTVTVTYAGNDEYKASSATFVLKVAKADTDIDVKSQTVDYGTAISESTVITVGKPAEYISFIIGLDAGEGKSVLHLNLPELIDSEFVEKLPEAVKPYVQGIIDKLENDGLAGDLTVAELRTALEGLLSGLDKVEGIEGIGQYVNIDRTSIEKIISVLSQIENLEGIGDLAIKVTVDGNIISENMNSGAYLIGAMVADSNYNSSMDIGYLLIKPQTKEVTLDFNVKDENGFITSQAIATGIYDMGSHVVKTEDLTEDDVKYASEKIRNIYVGLDIDGEVYIANEPGVQVGAYTQMAYIADLGNVIYYAVPIVRAYVVVADVVDVKFVDVNDNNRFYFEYDTTQKGVEVVVYEKDSDKIVEDYNSSLTVRYIGLENDVEVYNSTTAPTQAGTYSVIATYVESNEEYVSRVGMNVAVMVIAPAKAEVGVENLIHTYDGTQVDVSELITVIDDLENDTPKVTVITAAVDVEGDFSENGWNAVEGVMNIDFPERFDAILSQHFPDAYKNGIGAENIISRLGEVASSAEEFGFSADIFANITEILSQIPEEIRVTFKEQKDVDTKDIGAYIIGAVITDPNFMPEVGAGIVMIVPKVTEAELKWIYDDENGIITVPSLSIEGLLDAEAVYAGTEEIFDKANGEVEYLFVGVTNEGKISFFTAQSELRIGAYTQIAYILEDISADIIVAKPIMRNLVVTPRIANVEFTDENGNENYDRIFTYDNTEKEMSAVAYDENGNVLDGEMTYFYAGMESDGEVFYSEEAPTQTGAYNVIAKFVKYDEKGRVEYAGLTAGVMLVKPAEATIEVENEIHVYDSTEVDVEKLVTITENVETDNAQKIIITAGIDVNGDFSEDKWAAVEGTVNVDLPEKVDTVVKAVAGEAYENGITLISLRDRYETIRNIFVRMNIADEVIATFDEFIASLPQDTVLTFHDQADANPSTIGMYLITAMVFDPNYTYDSDMGIVVIIPDHTVIDLDWNYVDENGVITLPALENIDLGASAYVDGEYAAQYTEKIAYIITGVTADGKFVLTNDVNDITKNGTYTQIAYIPAEISSNLTFDVAEIRTFAVVTQTVEVSFVDGAKQFVYDGERHGLEVIVKDLSGNVIEGERLDNLKVTYIGIDSENLAYYDEKLPTDVGAYSVVATYAEYAESGSLKYFGMNTGAMVIKPATPEFEVVDKTITYDGNGHLEEFINNTAGLEFIAAYTDHDDPSRLNIIFPENWNIPTKDIVVSDNIEDLLSGIEKLPEMIKGTKLVEKFEELLGGVRFTSFTVNAAEPTDCGKYTVAALGWKVNYDLAATKNVVTIDHKTTLTGAKEATCEEEGHTGDYVCDCCKEVITPGTVIEKAEHTEEVIPAVEAKCTETGLTEGVKCSVCGEILVAQTEVPVVGHAWTDWSTVEKKCTEDGYDIRECSVCGESEKQNIIPASHRWRRKHTIDFDSTCTEPGQMSIHCYDCDEVKDIIEIAPAHQWEEDLDIGDPIYTVDKEPTCTEPGSESVHCLVCDDTNASTIREIPATGHDYEAVVTKPDCENGGYTTYTCSVCDDSYTGNETEALGHKYEAVVTRPDCENGGYTTYTCSVCDDSYTGNETEALGHEYEAVVTDPTCTKGGYTTYTCTVCDDSYTDDETEALGHDTEVDTLEPSCDHIGHYYEFCVVCWETIKYEEIPALGHTWSDWTKVDSTCTADGYNVRECSVCHRKETDPNGDEKAHTMGDWKVSIEAGCESLGEEKRECTKCDYFETREIPALGHTAVTDKAVDATCDKPGFTEGIHCDVCGKVLVKKTEVPALGHKMGDWTVVKPATCTEVGEETRKCETCGHTEKRFISTNGNHEMGEWTVETPSTCTQQGTEQRKCNNCDYTEQRKAALAQHTHKTVEGKKATCTETGLTDGIVCEVCGKEIVSQTEVSALGHKYDEGKVTEPATCLKDGEITYTCENCGDTKTETIKTEGHKYVVEGYVAPSCTYAGYTGDKTCEVCKDFIKGEMIPAGYGLRGDVNNDGKINAVDATQILRYCNNKASVLSEEMTEEELRMLEFIADVNCDGKINAIDATQILRECNNKASVFDQYETVKEAEICQLHKDIMDKLAKENQ